MSTPNKVSIKQTALAGVTPLSQLMPPDGQTPLVDLPFPAGVPLLVRAFGRPAAGEKSEDGRISHSHTFGQFYYLTEGLVVIETRDGRLLSPPRQLGWIPPLAAHRAHHHGRLAGWAAYVPADYGDDLPPWPAVLEVSPLTLHLLERLDSLAGAERSSRYEHLRLVFMDEVRAARPTALGLPYPSDPRLAQITDYWLKHPEDKRSIREWSRAAGFSERNLARKFSAETGLSPARWRRLARILRGREMMAEGRSVAEAAFSLGYENVSAFIEGFKAVFGRTPGLICPRSGEAGSRPAGRAPQPGP